jgi:glucose-6-phosphate isomerase
VETDSHRRIFEKAFRAEGIDAASRIVVVTDPGSPLQKLAEEAGYRKVFQADPHVGGRYSALTAFGLVPSGLAGADVATLLDEAAAASPLLSRDEPTNPGLVLGAALGVRHSEGAEKVVFADNESGIKGFPDWVEQLIAESTGKHGTGLLPVVTEGLDAPGFVDAGQDATPPGAGDEAKPSAVDGPVEVYGGKGGSLAEALRSFVDSVPEFGYISVQAYLDRLDDASAALLRPELARRTGFQTTFGWGPRFLHSTGQYHKGGHQNGNFLQLSGAVESDLEVPERPYTLGQLQHAQALGDGQVLAEHGRPVLRLHLTDRAAGLAEVARAVQEVGE